MIPLLDKNTGTIPENSFTLGDVLRSVIQGKAPKNALSWAAEHGHADIVKRLLKLGAEYNENNNYPLELASRNGHTEIVKILLNAGAKTSDSKNDEGYSLRMAANNGHATIVKLLLESGADPTADHYYTLRLALHKDHADIVELLLDAISAKRASNLTKKDESIEKPRVHIGTIGHIDHSKRTLTEAIKITMSKGECHS